MTARIVRLLDRRPDEDTLPIVKGIPMPPPIGAMKDKLRKTLAKSEPGDSFLWHENRKVYQWAREFGYEIVTQQAGDGFRVWRKA